MLGLLKIAICIIRLQLVIIWLIRWMCDNMKKKRTKKELSEDELLDIKKHIGDNLAEVWDNTEDDIWEKFYKE